MQGEDTIADTRATMHGVFMEVLDTGVLLTGDPAIGKSELALELITRGHRLISDDVTEVRKRRRGTLEGTAPPILRDFLEVRGLGILNIRAMFGPSSVRRRKDLNLIVQLRVLDTAEMASIDRLAGTLFMREILGISVAEVVMPVAPGRNLAIFVEAAVRNQILRNRGYDAASNFSERLEQQLRDPPPSQSGDIE